MAVSYILISAVAVLLAESLAGGLIVTLATKEILVEQPGLRTLAQKQAESIAEADARSIGLLASARSGNMSRRELLVDIAGQWMRQTAASRDLDGGFTLRGVTDNDGRLLLPSQPATFDTGSVPPGVRETTATSGLIVTSGPATGWATRPIRVSGSTIGMVYVQTQDSSQGPPNERTSVNWSFTSSGWIISGALTFALLVPLCVLAGLWSTRRLVSRIKRLAARVSAMAEGDLKSRVPVSGTDEVGRLEHGFNTMTERVDAARRAEQELAATKAERAERTRIARELHDSVSQDLFSLGLVTSSLRRKLPEGSRFREQAEIMEQTIEHTVREMRTMLLQLRPVALEEMGLVAALDDLCEAYRVRLGIDVRTGLDNVELTPNAEHIVLRVVQEALGNAARHGGAQVIDLSLSRVDGLVEVTVRDDGRGFDTERSENRHGMGLPAMAERITELGGTLSVTSVPERGTTVRARIPGRAN